MGIGHGLLFALIFGVIGAVLSLARYQNRNVGAAAAGSLIATFILVLLEDWAVHSRPVTTFAGLLPLILLNVLTLLIVVGITDLLAESASLATPVAAIALIALSITWLVGHGSGHGQPWPCPAGSGQHSGCIKEAVGLVHVTEYSSDTLPASTTTNLVVVTGDEAATKASQAMSSGEAATRNFSSNLDLGPATLQMIDGQMWYVFPLEFQGSINKKHLGSVEPGYIMVSAQDPNAEPVERYAPQFPQASMVVSLGGGQGSEPDRWAYDHGYSGYLLDDPTLEIEDGTGTPFWTVTLLSPQTGWTFQAPAGILLINAHTGQITRYDLPGRGLRNPVPSWVDRVYSSDMALRVASWYGMYRHAPFGGQGNSSRFQVSGDPVMVYTGDGNPSWRMLLTSFGNETSVYRIIEMDAATGAMAVYAPAAPMGIETSVAAAFCNAQGTGAGNVRASHLVPEHLTLHVIYGQLTWMASYEPSNPATQSGGSADVAGQQEGDTADPCASGEAPANSPTFTGIGFVTAYHVSASNVAYGSNLGQALANYQEQLAVQANAAPNAPGAGATQLTVTGTVCAKNSDTSGGNTTYYITMCTAAGKPDNSVVYTGQSANLGAPIVLSAPGDHVILKVAKYTATAAQQQIQSFSDAQHPLAGVRPSPSPSPSH